MANNQISSDRSSRIRKNALRRLSHEYPDDYAGIYEAVRPGAKSAHNARGQAWTILGRHHHERYAELYTLESVAPGSDIPPAIRSKAWANACRRLSQLRESEYRELLAQFQATGMHVACAYTRAVASLRQKNIGLFAELLAEEYKVWITAESIRTEGSDPSKAGQDE